MKLVDRYVIREIIPPFILGALSTVVLFQINQYMAVAKDPQMAGLPKLAVVQIILVSTPLWLKFTMPMGAALGTALGMTRIARESEITAMRAAGISMLRILRPVMLFGLLAGVANFYVIEKLIPAANKRIQQIRVDALGSTAFLNEGLSDRIFQLGDFQISLGRITKKGDTLELNEVLLIDRSDARTMRAVVSPTGRYDRGVWSFPNAMVYDFRGTEATLYRPTGGFVLNNKIELSALSNFRSGLPVDASIAELRERIRSQAKMRLPTKRDEIELHNRFAIPFACLVFSIVSPVFGIAMARSGGFAGVLVAFFVAVLYYNAHVLSSEILGQVPKVPAWVAAWLPNLTFGTLGLLALRKLR